MSRVRFEDAERALAERLSPAAVAHSERVARTAAALALEYGVDPEEARLAGLLHDWGREMTRDELLAKARAFGVTVTPVDETVPYLLHAAVGARESREVLPGLSEAVTDAIARHTVGDARMTDLDRIVYLADMLEEGRDFSGIEELRAAAGNVPLGELFARGYAASVAYVVAGRRHLHPCTVEVWNTMVAEGH